MTGSRYLKEYKSLAITATFIALLLGITTSSLALLIGPAAVGILSPDRKISLDQSNPFSTWFYEHVLALPNLELSTLLLAVPRLLIIFAVLKCIFTIAQWWMWEFIGESVARNLRKKIVDAYLVLSPMERLGNDARKYEGQILSTLGNDVRVFKDYLIHVFGGLPREGFQALALLVMLFFLQPKLTLLFLFVLAPLGVVLSKLSKRIKGRANKALRDYSHLTEWVEQRLIGIETIKHFATTEYESKKMSAVSQSTIERFQRMIRLKARTSPLIEAFGFVAMAFILWFAFNEISRGSIDAVTQITYFSSLALFAQSASKFGKYLNVSKEGQAALERAEDLCSFLHNHSETTIELPINYDTKESQIVLKNVSVRYPGQERDALKNFSFEFKAKHIYCVCGPSGAGKSTLINVILGLVKPTTGALSVSLSKKHPLAIAMMPQSGIPLFHTIAQNITYPLATVDEIHCIAALKAANIWTFVATLPQTVNTVIGEGGATLSGGQIQRILLARLFYHNSPICLIDEGTSALDPETEDVILDGVKRLASNGATVIMITHRNSSMKICNQILNLNDGNLIV